MPRFSRQPDNPSSARNFRKQAVEEKPPAAPPSHAARSGRGEVSRIGGLLPELPAGQSDPLPTSQETQCLRSMFPFRSSGPSPEVIREILDRPTAGLTLEESP